MTTRSPLLALCLTALVAVGCGSSDDKTTTTTSTDARAASESAPAAPEAGAFPVSIAHRYGTTTIEAEPKRVVVAGLREQDALLALGVVPVATTEWYGKHPGAIFPWARKALGDAKLPTVLSQTDGIDVERIAAQRPDLIVAVYSGLTKKEYAALSKLAPVIAQPKGQVDYGSSWQEETEIAGRAVGRPQAAAKLVAQTERLLADTAAKHPEFRDQTAAVVADYQGVYVYSPQDVRSRVLVELGFTYPKQLDAAFPGANGGQLSEERADALDVGVLVWFADGAKNVAKLKRKPVYRDLKVRKEGRDVFIANDDRVYDVTSFPTVLSMPTLVEELVPRLAAAADGDPSTSTDEQPAT